ncbi:hypothetical protein H4R20_000891 [Coemansia guatemalensis]|uniref:Uncharacterized protein n=1 Tax=Coemansia guatemalensis TaxID=2761395 RepID=A0A9W8I0B1_9FUNG|nr:hypothetical protein H4R20_000891 [Coemansia guatemalensis]
MDYKDCCSRLWKRNPQTQDSDTDTAIELLGRLESTLSTSTIPSRATLLDLLAVTCSLTIAGFDWAPLRLRQCADRCIAMLVTQLGYSADNCVLKISDFSVICAQYVKPYFGKAPPRPQYTLMGSDRRDRATEFGPQQWKEYPQAVSAFIWTLEHLDSSQIEDAVPSILPVVTTLLDDYECWARLRGLDLAELLLQRASGKFLRGSGIAALIDSSLGNSLVYQADAGDIGPRLLESAFHVAILASSVLYTDISDPRYTRQWWGLTDRLITNSIYVSDNVAANIALSSQVAPLCKKLGPAIARHLRALIGVLAQHLHSPGTLSPEVCRLHLVLVDQFLALADACPLRIAAYTSEITAALAVSWNSYHYSKSSISAEMSKEIGKLQNQIINAIKTLSAIDSASVRNAIRHLAEARPAVFSEWLEIAS